MSNTLIISNMSSKVESIENFGEIFESAPEAMLVAKPIDQGDTILDANFRAETLFGRDKDELVGSSHSSLFQGEGESFSERLREAFDDAKTKGNDWISLLGNGEQLFLETSDGSGVPVEIGVSALQMDDEALVIESYRDISARLNYREEVQKQKDAVRELSTPVIEVWEGIITVPLVGIIDSQRAQQITENLLAKVKETGADIAIIDITGVPSVDTEVANRLIKSVKTARLLGTDSYLVGIQPDIAESLVHLGVDLSDIETFNDLQSGLEKAFRQKGIRISDNER